MPENEFDDLDKLSQHELKNLKDLFDSQWEKVKLPKNKNHLKTIKKQVLVCFKKEGAYRSSRKNQPLEGGEKFPNDAPIFRPKRDNKGF